MVDLGQFQKSAFNVLWRGVARDGEDFVVVLGLGAFEEGVGFLEEVVEGAVGGVVVFSFGEGADGGVEVVGVELGLGAVEERREGCRVMGEGFGAVGGGAFVVVHLSGVLLA